MKPLTGRTHQLRAHAEAIGCPIVGDPKYGHAAGGRFRSPRRSVAGNFPTASSTSCILSARRLILPHPKGGMLDVTAPLPPHMKKMGDVRLRRRASTTRSRTRRRSKGPKGITDHSYQDCHVIHEHLPRTTGSYRRPRTRPPDNQRKGNQSRCKNPKSALRKHVYLERSGAFEAWYAPFDWINDRADVVIVGVTPGLQQGLESLLALRSAFLDTHNSFQAAEAAKQAASFKGTMRKLGARLMDHFGLHELFGLETTLDLFGSARASSTLHFSGSLSNFREWKELQRGQ